MQWGSECSSHQRVTEEQIFISSLHFYWHCIQDLYSHNEFLIAAGAVFVLNSRQQLRTVILKPNLTQMESCGTLGQQSPSCSFSPSHTLWKKGRPHAWVPCSVLLCWPKCLELVWQKSEHRVRSWMVRARALATESLSHWSKTVYKRWETL